MKLSNALSISTLALLAASVYAYPGMGKMDLTKRGKNDGPRVLIGDLATVGPTTKVGKLIAKILMGGDAQTNEAGYVPPGPFDNAKCKADTCCVWHWISQDLTAIFSGPDGCTQLARAAVRQGFHDAGAWSLSTAGQGGGADGSLILSGVELLRPENRGLQPIADETSALVEKYGVGMADLIQFMAVHATVSCPLGPRFRAFVGRPDSSKPAVDGLLPDVNADADSLIALFQDKTIIPEDLVALVGAHTTSNQFFVDTTKSGFSQDSTPGVWDTVFYAQTLQASTPANVFKFASDIALSKAPATKSEWKKFAKSNGQDNWNEDFSYSYVRLSLLGVNNINRKP